MTPALERLAEMVRQAEGRTRAQKLGAEVQKAADRFQAAERRSAAAEVRTKNDRPTRERELEQLIADEVKRKELIKRIANFIAGGILGPDEGKAFEQEIETSRVEIEAKRAEAKADLETILKEADESRKELKAARDLYQSLRKELDEVRPELAADFGGVDQLLAAAESKSPAVQIHALAREIADGERHFGMLGSREQSAQLKIWIGRFRKIQDLFALEPPSAFTEDDRAALHQAFPRLVGISKVYWPGYIEAFSRNYNTDWDRYIEDAQAELHLASDASRRMKDLEDRRQRQDDRAVEQKRQARDLAQASLEELRHIVALDDFPGPHLDHFLSLMSNAILGLGASDPELIQLALPHRELLDGKDLRSFRRHLDQAHQVDEVIEEDQALQDEYADVLALTRGTKALMIGGSAREESRRVLQKFFDFAELDWESHEGTRPALLKSLEERVKNRGMDFVLILKEFVGHIVPGRLRPLCEQHDLPCLMVEKGYGIRQMAETLRSGLKKTG